MVGGGGIENDTIKGASNTGVGGGEKSYSGVFFVGENVPERRRVEPKQNRLEKGGILDRGLRTEINGGGGVRETAKKLLGKKEPVGKCKRIGRGADVKIKSSNQG